METKIFDMKKNILDDDIFFCAKIIKEGGLVAFPTETVYGLGANALCETSVKKIYEAKGRPSDNPLIIHIGDVGQLDLVAKNVCDKTKALIKKFWPGALTVILYKKDIVPNATSGGLKTVAVRFPSNEIAKRLIKASVPLAAPSANTSGKPSPTQMGHVKEDLENKIEAIIDGGSCNFGLESTIIDMTENPPKLLRPGTITREMIEDIIGHIETDINSKKPKAPGMKYKHYSPNATIILVKNREKINEYLKETTEKVGILTTTENEKYYNKNKCEVITLGSIDNPIEMGSKLYKSFREFDEKGVKVVYSEYFGSDDSAIMNRLKKASSKINT